jgi:hypothetical protein
VAQTSTLPEAIGPWLQSSQIENRFKYIKKKLRCVTNKRHLPAHAHDLGEDNDDGGQSFDEKAIYHPTRSGSSSFEGSSVQGASAGGLEDGEDSDREDRKRRWMTKEQAKVGWGARLVRS